MENDYYVYVYIDPRSFEEFYYGKGRGDRKSDHLNDKSGSKKSKQIQEILNEGLKPIIKVIASGLTEHEAFLVEKAFIWKLGKSLTNEATGNFSGKFRPHNTLHKDVPGFDYKNDIVLMNVGEGATRCWEDCVKFGFVAAGQGIKYSEQLHRMNIGDVLVAYHKWPKGYVGIGIVMDTPKHVNEFKHNGKNLSIDLLKQPNIFANSENENAEYLVKVNWIKTVEAKNAYWKKVTPGLYANQNICSSMSGQPATIDFVSKCFELDLFDLVKGKSKLLKKAS